jgi:hypothetical protein
MKGKKERYSRRPGTKGKSEKGRVGKPGEVRQKE